MVDNGRENSTQAELTKLIDEFFEKRRIEEGLTAEEFVKGHPEYADRLREELEDELVWLSRAAWIKAAVDVESTQEQLEEGWHKVREKLKVRGTEEQTTARTSTRRPLRSILEWLAPLTTKPRLQIAVGSIAVLLVVLLARPWIFQPTVDRTPIVSSISFIYQSDDPGIMKGERKLKTLGPALQTSTDTDLVLTALDRYGIQIQPEEDVFLYVFQWDTSGSMAVLFPSSESSELQNPLGPGRVYRIPPEPKWFVLDTTPGIETIGFGVAVSPWDAMEKHIETLDKGTEEEKAAAMAKVKSLIRKAAGDVESGYYGSEFSFQHEIQGEIQ